MGHSTFKVRVRGIIINEGKLLTVVHPHNLNFCALPGGHLEPREDIRQALEREIFEELGVRPAIGRLLYINNFSDTDGEQSIEFFFEITNGKDYENLSDIERSHAHEIAEVKWMSKEDDFALLPAELREYVKNETLLSDTVRFIYN